MPIQNRNEKIIIIDFGSQVTKLIARRIRDIGVFSEIITIKDLYKISDFKQIKGVIFLNTQLSGLYNYGYRHQQSHS